MNQTQLGDILYDPIVQAGLLSLVGALLAHVVLSRHPALRLIGHLALFVALTLLLLYHGIVPYERGPSEAQLIQRLFIGLAKIVWWTNAALSLVGSVRVFLVFERQPREGRLIQDLAIGVIYVGVALSVVAYVFDFPVGTLIATSGVFAIVFGLALQSTLNDVFSGIALNIGRPYAVGDWIVLDGGIEGRVLETNWRATHLLNGTDDLVVLPNSNLAKATVINQSSPDPVHGVKINVRLLPTTSPAAVVDVMRNVLMSAVSILTKPAPGVTVISLDALSIEVEISFRVASFAAAGPAQNEIFDLIYRHVLASGLVLSHSPAGEAGYASPPLEVTASALQPTSLRLLNALPLFTSLTDDERKALASTMTRRTYRKGEVVAKQDEVLGSLMIVRTGVLGLSRHESEREIEIARLAPGDCFGEEGLLTGTGEIGTIRALTFVVVYEIEKTHLAPLMRDRPRLADELGEILARHARSERHLQATGDGHEGDNTVARLTLHIRQLFHL
ncbi:cyclic nucleotide-binding domain-containing protein [Mesorhizobium erdmanii]|uniref:cyclic nucleotide-binding domain-containing protein n=1 Tax=Mesorhizobium erdmanii TaxID=1777866 RepID=UPI0003F6DA73|nr:mechanosensitive ion channel family protein [Mesorhizobium erdmanii]